MLSCMWLAQGMCRGANKTGEVCNVRGSSLHASALPGSCLYPSPPTHATPIILRALGDTLRRNHVSHYRYPGETTSAPDAETCQE